MNFFDFDVKSMSKADLLQLGFVEVLIGISPERTLCLKNNVQGKRTQYGLRHRVTSTQPAVGRHGVGAGQQVM